MDIGAHTRDDVKTQGGDGHVKADWRDAAISQGAPGIAHKLQKRRGAWNRRLLTALRRKQPCRLRDLRFLDSRTVIGQTLCSSHPVFGVAEAASADRDGREEGDWRGGHGRGAQAGLAPESWSLCLQEGVSPRPMEANTPCRSGETEGSLGSWGRCRGRWSHQFSHGRITALPGGWRRPLWAEGQSWVGTHTLF